MDGAFAYHFDDKSISPIKITETHDEIGCRVWDAATLLGKFLEAHAGELAGILAHRNIVELGAGTGITAMVAARLLPPSVRILATDIPTVCRATQATLASNSLDKRVTCEPLVWGNVEHIAAAHEWARSRPTSGGSAAVDSSDAAAAAAGLAASASEPQQSGSAVDLVIACDIAAPIKFADSFVDTVAALLPPPPAGGSGSTCVAGSSSGSAAGSGSADASSARAAAVEGAAAPAAGCGAGDSGSAASREGSSAEGEGPPAAESLADLLRLPCALLACQMHRDITEPLLDGLRSVYGSSAVREVPQSLLHPSFRSPRHTLYVVATGARR